MLQPHACASVLGFDPSQDKVGCASMSDARQPDRKKAVGGALSLEGVSQMDSILPDRLLALVRPGNDLVLRRSRSLKRCVQACGCKIMTPRYACNLAPGCISNEPTFAGLRKKTRGPKKKGKGVSFGKA